jgi:hypothetical protein
MATPFFLFNSARAVLGLPVLSYQASPPSLLAWDITTLARLCLGAATSSAGATTATASWASGARALSITHRTWTLAAPQVERKANGISSYRQGGQGWLHADGAFYSA